MCFGAASPSPAFGATHLVRMKNFAFDPESLTINVGDTVLWTNTTTTGHNVVSDTSAWPAPALFTRPGTFPFNFTEAGTYGYFCSPHKSFGMTGTIVVQGAANQQPIVALTNPPPGLTLAAPATIVLGASASDPMGASPAWNSSQDRSPWAVPAPRRIP